MLPSPFLLRSLLLVHLLTPFPSCLRLGFPLRSAVQALQLLRGNFRKEGLFLELEGLPASVFFCA